MSENFQKAVLTIAPAFTVGETDITLWSDNVKKMCRS